MSICKYSVFSCSKIAICSAKRKKSQHISDGNILFLDGSSTVQFLLPYLGRFHDLVVITNGLKIAQTLGEMHIKTYVTGGLLMDNSSVLIGEDTQRFIQSFNADICFISCKGISDDGKLTDTSYSETQLRKYYLQNAKTKVALLTQQKIGKKYLHTLCHVDELDHLITPHTYPYAKKI